MRLPCLQVHIELLSLVKLLPGQKVQRAQHARQQQATTAVQETNGSQGNGVHEVVGAAAASMSQQVGVFTV